MDAKRQASRSDAQQIAGRAAITEFGRRQGVRLEPHRLTLRDNTFVIDGYYEGSGRTMLAEVWAHVGSAKPAQQQRVRSDILKLALLSKILREERPGQQIECTLVFLDEEAAGVIGGRSWTAVAAREFDVKVAVVPIGRELIAAVKTAQTRQDIRRNEG